MPELTIKNGLVYDEKVKWDIVAKLDHGPLSKIDAIVVHQTDSSTAEGTLAGYKTMPAGNGAHFLIGKDGAIFQVVSILRKCQHVGPVYSKCQILQTCTLKDKAAYNAIKVKGFGQKVRAIAAIESKKDYPDRYPLNSDSIGIEIVGKYLGEKDNPTQAFEKPTAEQQKSLSWLVQGLLASLKLTGADVYRHPDVSRKMAGEARDAAW